MQTTCIFSEILHVHTVFLIEYFIHTLCFIYTVCIFSGILYVHTLYFQWDTLCTHSVFPVVYFMYTLCISSGTLYVHTLYFQWDTLCTHSVFLMGHFMYTLCIFSGTQYVHTLYFQWDTLCTHSVFSSGILYVHSVFSVGHFMYTEAYVDGQAILSYTSDISRDSPHCYAFWYFMNGHVGSLSLEISRTQDSKQQTIQLWRREGHHDAKWLRAEIDFPVHIFPLEKVSTLRKWMLFYLFKDNNREILSMFMVDLSNLLYFFINYE